MDAVRDVHVTPPLVVRTTAAAVPAAMATVGVPTLPAPIATQYKSLAVPTADERAHALRRVAGPGAGIPPDVDVKGAVAVV
jgi:hypothetical protein